MSVIDPHAMFETQKDGVIAIRTVNVTPAGGAANSLVITAVTGKVIRILDVVASSTGAASSVGFFSGSAARLIRVIQVPANTVATPNVILGPSELGVMTLDVSTGLYVNLGAVSVDLSVNYIIFTP